MQLPEQDKPAFKQWLLPKLANRTEAEPEVLADYVAELFAGEGSPAEIKRASVEQLSDFLEDYTEAFVDEIATAIEQKIWTRSADGKHKDRKKLAAKGKAKGASQPAPPTATPPTGPKADTATSSSTARLAPSALAPDAPVFVPRAQPIPTAPLSNDGSIPTGPRADRNSNNVQNGSQRKRKLHERDTGGDNAADSSAGERPHKQLARRGGGHSGRNGQRADATAATAARAGLPPNVTLFTPNLFAGRQPTALPRFSPHNPLDPFSFLANLSAMMSMGYSGQALGPQPPNLPRINPAVAKIKCRDYETKGICHLGTLCPYDHGKAVVVPADPEYDPNNASLAMLPHLNGHRTSYGNRNSFGIQRARAPFSHSGPSRGPDDTLSIEQIPEDHFTEQHVRDFFSQFGAIVDVQIRTNDRVAVVKFSDHPAAQRAYDSPKAIFDNRFVKAFWHNPDHKLQSNGANGAVGHPPRQDGIPAIYNEDEEMFDREEFSKQQAQLQKEFEEKRRRSEEVTARSNMISAQLNAKEEELDELRSALIVKARAKGLEVIIAKEQQAPPGDLAKLQAEAAGLFTNSGSIDTSTISRGGFINGRGSSLRGSFRGRGNAREGRGGVVRLDNRPRSLAVAGVKAESEKEIALKRHLLNVQGCTGVRRHAERADTLVIGFEQRFQAEIFLNEASRIPHVSIADLSWVPNEATVVQQSIEFDDPMVVHQDTDDEVSGGEVDVKVEVDLDVADDNDQWL
ncbi:hypothetical protein P171DRAFT_516816 [Karstenula rhodostoma CBS 690.94]|uniref:CCCH zinc finger and RRM domain-containing protein n=1 Tax=Karstenula rhodostoma CBS 690.94 TaxID=1392251 RepID=A0A9P4PYA3_9PLEO|nr:hypothetical protein P171DRAFT_516816 [Karstenula rhodostoma CBS 690.94]